METGYGDEHMVVGDIATGTQVAVIGAGPGGYVAAIRAAQLGKEVTLIERDPQGLGGICLNHGCIPSKTLIYAINQYHQLARLETMGISLTTPRVDLKRMQQWKEKSITDLRNGIALLMKKYGVNVLFGEAQFESSRKLKVVGSQGAGYIEFERAIIATGSRPRVLPGFEPDGTHIITSREALQLQEIPRSMVVIGGGFIGLELSGMFAKMGTKVAIVEKFGLVPHVEKELVAVVRQRLTELGVMLYENSTPERWKKEGDKLFVFAQSQDKGAVAVEADKILVAVGVQPNVESIGLEKTKVQKDSKGFVQVNPARRTTDPYIYAIGDVTGSPTLAHKAFLEAKVAAESIAGLPSAFDTNIVPWVIFSDPEIATVGLGEEEARQQGHHVKVGRFPFAALGRAVSVGRPTGFVKIVADQNDNTVLGVHIVGPQASNIISEAALGMEMGMRLEDLAATIHPHPTFSEALAEAAEATLGRAINIWQPREG